MEGGQLPTAQNQVHSSRKSRSQFALSETLPTASDAVISVKEARKLLPKDLQKLSDGEVETITHRLHSIAKSFINSRV